jgi:hypothetical protein
MPRLQLASTDADVVMRFLRAVGYGKITMPTRRAGRKQQWVWTAAGWPVVIDFATELGPYLGERRRARLDEVMSYYAPKRPANSRKDKCPAGHGYTQLNTYIAPDGSRQCRMCRRAQKAKVA